jgi:hypothetical protein
MKQALFRIPPRILLVIIAALGTLVVLKLLSIWYGFDLATALTSAD